MGGDTAAWHAGIIIPIAMSVVCMFIMHGARQHAGRFGMTNAGPDQVAAAGSASICTAGSILAVLFRASMMGKVRWNLLKVVLAGSLFTAVALALVLLAHEVAIAEEDACRPPVFPPFAPYGEGMAAIRRQGFSGYRYTDRQQGSRANGRGSTMSQTKERTIYLAGGCFWGLQAYLDLLPGVKETEAGYAQGSFASPTYDQVCAGGTGHAETVRVVYDASVLPTAKLLDAFFEAIDPTTANRQGPDVGSQYRSGIWWVDEADEQVARAAIRRAQSKRVRGIVTKVEKLAAFYPAEAGHQHYLAAHPGAYCHIDLGKAREFAFSEEGMAGKEGGLSTAERIASHGYAKPKDRVLRGRLTERQYAITQKGATEPPFSSMLDDCFERGIYVDVTTGEPLFSSASKYDAGCGWPSFHKPIDPSVTIESVDKSQGMVRIEVRSHAGNAHLGHVFSDGVSEQGGARYCINGAALRFVPFDEMDAQGYGYLKELVPDVDWGGRS